MVKRAPTPPPADDTRFFTVLNPYPQQPYIRPLDTKTFAQWIACVIGQEHFLAFYHKPKSPNVVIIETSKFGPDFDRLMGEHRWSEFLRGPSNASGQETSSIFPCTLTTQRAVAKSGWVCRDVTPSLFKEWSPAAKESPFTYPYPAPRHCDPPIEDVTRSPLCRPIPQRPEAEAPLSTAQFFASRRAAPPASASSSSEDLLAASMSSDGVSDFLIARDRFIPAIHGSDIPKAGLVVIRPTAGSPPPLPTADTSASDDDDEAEKGLCSAHGVLCVSGICMECAARKREAKLAERALERGAGRGRGWGQMSEREPRKEHAGMRRGDRQPIDRAATLPRHLKAAGAGGKLDDGPRSRVRDDIRVEMANRAHTGTQGAKSVASSGTRALPPHLGKVSSDTRKTVKPRTPAFASSISDTSSAAMSTSAPSDDGLSESSRTSELSSFEPSSEDASLMPFRPTAVFSAPPIHPPGLRIPDAQRGVSRPWGPRAAISEEDTESVTTETHVALENAWKQVRATRASPLKQADKAKAVPSPAPAAVRDSWDDDSSEDEDSEPF